MSKVKKIALAGAVAVAALGAGAGVASADDGSGACVTRNEYSQVRRGMTQPRVAQIFGTNGRKTYDSAYAINRQYKTCRPYSAVVITFNRWDRYEPFRVYAKNAFWS